MSTTLAVRDNLHESAFFAPVSSSLLEGLFTAYDIRRAKIERVAAFFSADMREVLHYFLEGNRRGDNTRHSHYEVDEIFTAAGALKTLNSSYWTQALGLTDVYNAMPQARRDEWDKQIKEHNCPDFTPEIVVPTIRELLQMREKFFAERVDGIFRALSGEHVTNQPMGFGKRMIIAHVCSGGYPDSSRTGSINDLRCVIAKFMGSEDPRWDSSSDIVRAARAKRGEWQLVDGGALRIRCYMIGTAHLEIHPDMAWRLNGVLASLYPQAIPASFRQKPKKLPKDFVMMARPIPFAVRDVLAAMEPAREWEGRSGDWNLNCRRLPNTLQFRYDAGGDKTVRATADKVLESIGGVWQTASKGAKASSHYLFDYDPTAVVSEIVCSGCIPDQVAHQFYGSPETVARAAVEILGVEDEETYCEPSAGQAGIAQYLPKYRTTCVEIAPLHCKILQAKGFVTIQADFLKWSETIAERFSAVIANPPFSQGRWQAHLEAAARIVDAGGRMVFILPASARGKQLLPGWRGEWSGVFDNEFTGTSVSVAICRLERAA